jgi:hypothetical protein
VIQSAAEAWQEYVRANGLEHANPGTRQLFRRCFLSGFFALLKLTEQLDECTQQLGDALFERLDTEHQEFLAE